MYVGAITSLWGKFRAGRTQPTAEAFCTNEEAVQPAGAYPSPFLGGVEHLDPSVRRAEGVLSYPTFEAEVLLPASASMTTTFGSPIRPSSLRMRDTFEISGSEKHMITLIAFSVVFAAL